MAGENPKNVAKKVSESIRKGKLVNLGKIIKESGYSEATSKCPTIVKNTKAYQKEIQPVVKQLEKEIQRVIKEMKNKDLNSVQYGELSRVLDTLIKNNQLLSGGVTDRTENKFNNEQIDEIAKRIHDRKGGDGKICGEE